jgi:HlyD family secretion protein
MGRILKILVILAVIAGVAAGVYAFFNGREPAGSGLKLVEVTSGSITEKAVAVGQIEPRFKFSVKSKNSGIVKRAAVEVGDRVRPGDILFEIQPDPTPSELIEADRWVERARTTYNLAELEYNRAEQLAREGILSRGDVDAKKEAFEQARISLAQAQDTLDLIRKGRVVNGGHEMESIVRAPAGGILLSRSVNPGDPVVPLTSYQPGTELATIADMSDLIFKGTVDEIDVGKLRVGLPARLKVGALPDATVTGRVSRIAPQAVEKDNARLFDVEIELDPGQDVLLRAGYSANADLVLREKHEIAILPERLVTFDPDGSVWVEVPADQPGAEPRKVTVEVGLSDGLNIEIVSGLEKGDKVVQRPPREIVSAF